MKKKEQSKYDRNKLFQEKKQGEETKERKRFLPTDSLQTVTGRQVD